MMQDKPMMAVALLGPTASGKSALAMQLAQHLPIEIVSVDSAQVYRAMNIGTAKPSTEMQARVPHHLLDLRNPDESYSAAAFVQDATRALSDIYTRGKVPLLVGGTMLYIKALRDGLSTLPAANPQVRERLSALALAQGWPALHARLAHVDPVTAARVPPNDSQRIQRALEVYELTGIPMSALHAHKHAQGAASTQTLALKLLALVPDDRALLHQRIAQRFHLMVQEGLVEELRALRAQFPALNRDLPSMRSVGYRQAWAYLEGECAHDAFIDQALSATRGLAKRQLTWLRGMPDVQPFFLNAPHLFLNVLSAVRAAYGA